ncbi:MULTISPECIES: transcriptional regulator domain-containing protein [Bradyrhizobium]|uniref:transcriptional regulator domain-containing protein n=1 Tax=Bradyrhizobium TaxID=374 RepID=UPI000D379985
MSEFDWLPGAYQHAIKSGEVADFAWEAVRRRPNYRNAYRDARSKGGQVSEFRRRWASAFANERAR